MTCPPTAPPAAAIYGLPALAALSQGAAASVTCAPIRIAGREYDFDSQPAIMGVVNLSRDSTYRDSIAVSAASALRRARIMVAQGADFVDVGAESTTAAAARLGPQGQLAKLLPAIEALTGAGVVVSVESYQPEVVSAALRAGAAIVNLTGTRHERAIYALAAEHQAAVVICYSPGADARDIADYEIEGDPIPRLLDHFGIRMELARACGASELIIDPGLGLYYANLIDPLTRARAQARMLLQSVRLRCLGVPVAQAMPHAFDLFEEEFRAAEGFFAGLSFLAHTSIYRTHETAHVAAILRAISAINATPAVFSTDK
ncbi:MAG: dihydropteroate synthase [Candidatus Nanopelagicales bacterium]